MTLSSLIAGMASASAACVCAATLLTSGCALPASDHAALLTGEVEPVAGKASALTIPDPSYPSGHAPIPLLTYRGGPLITAPELVTVTFAGDTSRDFLDQFGDSITSTPWWDAVSEGYCDQHGRCVGHGAGAGHVRVTEAPAPSYEDTAGAAPSSLKRYIETNIQSGLFPAPNANTIYLLYFPDETTVVLDGMASCTQFGAYHNAMTTTSNRGGAPVTFAFLVIPRCADGQNVLTLSASHELIEAATDPVYDAALGSYTGWGSSGDAWDYASGGEVADRCVRFDKDGAPADTYQEGLFLVQRSFSNVQARGSHDPCVPSSSKAGPPYFNVAPELGDVLDLKVGQTVKILLTAFSDEPTPPFTLSVEEAPAAGHKALGLTLGMTSVQNGQAVYLTVTLKAEVPGKIAPLTVTSKLGSSSQAWPLLVREIQ